MNKDNTTHLQWSEKSGEAHADARMLGEVELYLRAVELAHVAHAGQKYGDLPYTRHLAHVESVLHRFGHQEPHLLAAAWLHDVVEDTAIASDEVLILFGSQVANLVAAVTDGEGENRKKRKAATYQRIRCFAQAVVLKLADRIANVESCIYDGGAAGKAFLEMYRKEHPSFCDGLRFVAKPLTEEMWVYLDELLSEGSI